MQYKNLEFLSDAGWSTNTMNFEKCDLLVFEYRSAFKDYRETKIK